MKGRLSSTKLLGIIAFISLFLLSACESNAVPEPTPTEKYTVTISVNFVPNFIFSKYNVNFLVDDEREGTLEHGTDGEYELILAEGEHELTFAKAGSLNINGEVTLTVDCDIEAKYKISCYNDHVSVTEVSVDRKYDSETEIVTPSPVPSSTLPMPTLAPELTTPIPTSIPEPTVSISTPTPETTVPTITPEPTAAPTTENAVYYSTNDLKTAKKGNSGVFAYKNIGGSYDIYYIIDFDEGYVYYFLDGNGDTTCERVKMDSGDLNSVLIITYHDGSDTWSYGLHFNWKNQPDHLIVEDNDHFEYDFYPTDLDDALAVRDKKSIVDY